MIVRLFKDKSKTRSVNQAPGRFQFKY